MGTDFAVVGTDTGVGKTVLTAGIVGWLREAGVEACAVKPCQTGYPPDDDAGVVAEACGTGAAARCLRRLKPALAPAVAADEEGVDLSYGTIRDGCREALAATEVGVVEGIGGLRVPLAEGQQVIDLVADLNLPALVVSRSGLGTLNHTALTVDALRQRDIDVHGVILNEYEGATLAERTNPPVIEQMTDCPVWEFPPIETGAAGFPEAVRSHLPAAVVPGTSEQALASRDT